MNRLLKSCPLAALMTVLALPVLAEQVLQYEPSVVGLTGIVKMEKHYGPPGFGESPKTDQVSQVPILVLDAPVNVQANAPKPGQLPIDDTSYSGVRRIQLVFSTPGSNPASMAGKHVTATGTLFQKMTGENYTDVLLSVQKISLMPQ